MQDDKNKKVVTVDKVLFIVGLISSSVILISMGLNWFRHGTPFIGGLGLFQNPIADTLFLLVLAMGPFTWGLSERRKK